MSHPPDLMTSDIGQQLREKESAQERAECRPQTLHKLALAYNPHRQHASLHQAYTQLHVSFQTKFSWHHVHINGHSVCAHHLRGV